MRSKRFVAAVLLMTAADSFALSGCGLLSPQWNYVLRPEPTLPADEAEVKITAERQPIELRYGYKSLDSMALQQAYDILDEKIRSGTGESFVVPGVGANEFLYVVEAYEDDHPEVFWLDTSSRYSYIDYGDSCEIRLRFIFEGDELEQAKNVLEQQIAAVIASAPETATDYELECFLNDYMISHCDYDREAVYQHNAYGSLVRQQAVCDGYSKGFQLLCSRMGIACVTVQGTAAAFNTENGGTSDDGHMWNCVNIEGDWYHVDVTWNDGKNRIQHFCYLNLTTDEVGKSHTIFPVHSETDGTMFNVFVPECRSLKYNYFNHDCPMIHRLDEDDEVIAALAKAAKKRSEYLDVVISLEFDYDTATKTIASDYAYSWMEAANYYNNNNPRLKPDSEYYTYKNLNILTFHLEYES